MAADGHNTPARNDPFGQRYLRNEEAVFDYNAWDDVDWPEDKDSEICNTLNHQRECPVPADLVFELFETPEKQWDDFYRKHNNKFFMDRKWLIREFPELFHQNESGKQIKILEVGCGVGNTTIPLLGANPNLFIYSCDFSKNAIETLKSDYRIDKERCQLFVWDVTKQEGDHQISDCSLDYILCIFVLSAIRPTCLKAALQNLVRLLKPGGMLLVKDYGRHDLTQLRFKSNRLIDENFYQRGDGTLVYFFTLDELDRQFSEIGLKQRQCFMDKRTSGNC